MALSTLLKALGAVVLVSVSVSACDNGPSAVTPRDRVEVSTRDYYPGTAPQAERRRERAPQAQDAPDHDGRPLWSSSRRYSAEENARRHFERNGEAIGARSYDDFLDRVHAFVRKPPRGALTLERANGDRLLYDPKTNLFAVVTREGAPRTMFKPDDGMAYWERQVAREARRTTDDAETQDG